MTSPSAAAVSSAIPMGFVLEPMVWTFPPAADTTFAEAVIAPEATSGCTPVGRV